MDNQEQQHLRLLLLGLFMIAAMLVYFGVLYDTQVTNHEFYLAQSIRSITREENVEASRGIITDRSGRALVTNRSTYSLTFDASLLKDDEDENEAILRLVQLCREMDVPWVDNLPISRDAPFTYTVDQLSQLQRLFPGRATAPQDGTDPGDHLHHTEGLGQIVVGPGIQGQDLVIFRTLGSCHDHGNGSGGRGSPESFQDRNAVHTGQHHIQQDQSGLVPGQGFKQAGAVGKALRRKAGGPQGIEHKLPDAGIVFNTINHSNSSRNNNSLP